MAKFRTRAAAIIHTEVFMAAAMAAAIVQIITATRIRVNPRDLNLTQVLVLPQT